MEDEREALYRSMVDERILLLGRLKAYQDRFDAIRQVADIALGRPAKNEALLKVRTLAEEALTL